ncbi:MAG: DUF3396 domain-containing protein [Desulfovibrio sp.]|jgi:hypothetical protein|nr:DUF3396 domain-containing protein [Desulfovibrio sp.]
MLERILHELNDIVSVSHEKGVLLKLCFDMVLYTEALSNSQQREAVLSIFNDYCDFYQKHLRWTTNPETGRWKKLKKGPADYLQPKEWLLDKAPGEGWAFVYHGGEKKTDATDIVFLASGRPFYGVEQHDLSTVACRFPLADFFAQRFSIQTLLKNWCALLQPWHGRAGLSIGKSFGYADWALSRVTESELLLRYPGLQFWSVGEGLYFENKGGGLYDGPRCADWIIVLSDHFVEKLGGKATVIGAMDPLPTYEYPGGLILQAGEFPQLGSYTEKGMLADYMRIGKIIEPIRASRAPYAGEIAVADPQSGPYSWKSDKERSQTWCERFSPDNASN